MKVGIIIVNYNGKLDTMECLISLDLYHKNNSNITVFLVDNNSYDPLDDYFIKKLDTNVLHIKNTNNEGFAKGNNIGITKALESGCELIALINNDTVFVDDSLQKVINCFKNNPSYGILGMINYYYSDPNLVWQSGFSTNLFWGFSAKIGYTAGRENIVPVDYVPGSSIVVRSDVFKDIGFLDEKYFAYFEEYDFCIRAKKNGINIGFLNGSRILHKVGKSSTSTVQLYFRTRNKLMFYHKYASTLGFICAFVTHIIVSTGRIIFSKNEKLKMMRALIFGVKDYFNNHLYEGSIETIK